MSEEKDVKTLLEENREGIRDWLMGEDKLDEEVENENISNEQNGENDDTHDEEGAVRQETEQSEEGREERSDDKESEESSEESDEQDQEADKEDTQEKIYKIKWRGQEIEVPESEVPKYLSKGYEMDKWKMEHARDIELMTAIKNNPELREEFNNLILSRLYGINNQKQEEKQEPSIDDEINDLDKKINEIYTKLENDDIIEGKEIAKALKTIQEYTEKKAMLIASKQAEEKTSYLRADLEVQSYAIRLQNLMDEIEATPELKNKVEETLEILIDADPDLQKDLTSNPIKAYNVISNIYKKVAGDTNLAHSNNFSVGSDTKKATSDQVAGDTNKPKKKIPLTNEPSTTGGSNYTNGKIDVFNMSSKEIKKFISQNSKDIAKWLSGEY